MIEMRKIMIITGLPGSGKTTVSSYIREKGIPVFLSGDVIRDEMKRRGLEFNNRNSEMVASDIRKKYGMDYPTRKTGEKIKKVKAELVCVDGPRDVFEVRYLTKLGHVILLIVEAPEKIRYQRFANMKGYKRVKNYEEFKWRDSEELKRGMKELIETDEFEKYRIKNDGSMQKVRKSVDAFLEKLQKE